jgi:hypothetical protein
LMVIAVVTTCLTASAADYVTTTTSDGRVVTATAVNDNIIRVTNTAKGEAAVAPKTTITPANVSKSVSISETDSRYVMLTTGAGVTATLDRKTGQLTSTAVPTALSLIAASARARQTASSVCN